MTEAMGHIFPFWLHTMRFNSERCGFMCEACSLYVMGAFEGVH
jgi:hypothetical protein